MDIWDEIKKLTGYQSGYGGVDSYGVDHSGFSTRDELEYQSARLARENQLAEGFAKQGIAEENYPQYGTNFWGGSPENNYGFGTSNIKQNIENVTNRLNNDGFGGGVSNGFGSGASNSGFGNTPTNSYGNNLNNNQTNNGYNYTTDIQKQQCIDSSGMQCTPQNNNNSANMTSRYPDYSQPASLEFDGQNLVWLQNGQPVKYYPAVSGRADYQSAQYTNERKRGPIPEGDYLLGQGTGEDYNNKEEMSWWRKFVPWNDNPWYENPAAWGKSRIPIQPLPTTNTFGRHSMYVHGGNVPGSAGCIDLTYANDDFYNDFKNYNGTLPLKVKYKKGW